MAFYYNVNDDMDKKAAKLFKQLSDDNKDYLEKAYEDAKKSGKPLSTEEINSFLEIKDARRQIAHADEQWEKGKWAQQNVNPDIAKEYYDTYVDKHQKIIDRNKALHRESAFIKDKRVDLSGSGKNTIDTSGILKTHQAGMINWEDIKNLGTKAGEGIIRALQYVDPFSSVGATENKDSFIFPEKKYRTSNVYDDIGQHSERRIQEKQFSENYDRNFLDIDNIEPSLGMDGFVGIDNIEPGKYIEYKPEQAQTWLQKQLEKHNAAQRAYNDTTGLNTNRYLSAPQHGNIDNAARVGRRNQARIDNVLGDFISGASNMSMKGRHNLIGALGTPHQQRAYLHEYGRQTGENPDGSQWSNPYVNQNLYNDPDKGGIIGTIDPYGNTITRDTINQDVTGMYTDSGSSGMDDIGDITSSASTNNDWSEMTYARGGRIGYAEGGIVNLLPKGAW